MGAVCGLASPRLGSPLGPAAFYRRETHAGKADEVAELCSATFRPASQTTQRAAILSL